ncbi:SDR family oxidoreductase [Geodermatophilus sp. CPCC 206100]|uniref:SDR family oxidoreductase n=1 Tax=Geodermatophilus sp. CPCC 206100 TaxID=3020054 RepID=UPI003B005B90
MQQSELDGRAVVLTGGASGIGLALSRALRRLGCSVVDLDRTDGTGEGAEDDGPGRLLRVRGDVTDPEANESAVALALREFGRLDAFIGNAGVHDGGAAVTDLTPTQVRDLGRRVLDVNVVGYMVGACAAAEAVAQAGGTMVFTLSDASYVVSGNGAGLAYAASKHAALGVVRSLAAQLAPRVRVNAVAPGGVPTGLSSLTPESGEQKVYGDVDAVVRQIRSLNPLGTVLSPEDLVGHYLYLLTGQSRGLTGAVLRPDGGLSVA